MENRERYFVISFAIAYFVYYSIFSVLQHNALNSTLFDLGLHDQVIWNTAHGRIGESSLRPPVFFADHLDILQIFFAPFYWIWEDVRIILILQSLILSLGIFPVYYLARDVLHDSKLSVIFALSYIIYPYIGYKNQFDFHPVVFVIPFLLFAFYYLQRERYGLFICFLMISVITKEEISFTVMMFGLFIILFERNKKLGWILLFFGLGYLFIATGVIIPYFKKGSFTYLDRYSHLGAGFFGILETIIFKPIYTIKSSLSYEKVTNLLLLFLPLGFLSFFSPKYLLMAVPSIIYNILSNWELQMNPKLQYSSVIIPFIFISAIYGMKSILNSNINANLKKILILFLIILSLKEGARQFYRPLRHAPLKSQTSISEFARVKSLILPQSSLAVSNSWGAHFSHRRELYIFPPDIYSSDKYPEFILINLEDKWSGGKENLDNKIKVYLSEKGYRVAYQHANILLLKKQ